MRLNWLLGVFMSIRSGDLYKAINACLKPVKDDLGEIDTRVRAIISQLDNIEERVKNLGEQLTHIEKAVEEKAKA